MHYLCLLTYCMTSFMACCTSCNKTGEERCLGEKVFFKFEKVISNYLKPEQYPCKTPAKDFSF